ncbi:response regulator transcription factor [Streptomyces sp. NPDC001508]|uniref:response regulator transcription factor n=1 Tax=Streptomyces sp. NPDC001508 TaxID=3154656 RepID=UPI00332C6D99
MHGQDVTRDNTVRVLIVDDEPELSALLSAAVADAGWQPYVAGGGHKAIRLARDCAPHAVVLDWMLPDLDGLHVLRRLRSENTRLPILMLTARDALAHRLEGLSAGADDYVTKPFALEEVMLRLRGLLRRVGTGAGTAKTAVPESVRRLGDLVLSESSREAWRGSTPVRLTTKEFDLLWFLMGRPRQVFSKAQLLDRIWNSSFDGEGNLIEVYIYSLRSKIDKGRAPMIHTVRGLGYTIRPAEDGHPVAP